MLAAIAAAKTIIRFETYIYRQSPLGEKFRAALMDARARGVHVLVLIDAIGSTELPEAFWQPLLDKGGRVHRFNPFRWGRFFLRNHRKLLVCDDRTAFIGGYNIAPEYEGDGVSRGWRDLGVRIDGPVAHELAHSFDEMFGKAAFHRRFFARLKKAFARKRQQCDGCELLFSGPGLRRNPIAMSLRKDLAKAHSVQIIAAYFLPSWRIRRSLLRIARRGGRVQLILPARSDVPLSLLASQRLYQRFLSAGVEIYEYQPQILHEKLIVIDDAAYVGSANLDTRSLYINYELLLRLTDHTPVADARALFAAHLPHCRRVDPATWKQSRSLWHHVKERWAYFLLARLDPYIARKQVRTLR